MRKVLISLAAAGTALAFASPAAAQYYPQQPYGQDYGYGNQHRGGNWGAQLQQLRNEMQQLASRGRLTRSEHRDMDRDIRAANQMLRNASYGGINNRQAQSLDRQFNRLRNQLHRYADRDRRNNRRGW